MDRGEAVNKQTPPRRVSTGADVHESAGLFAKAELGNNASPAALIGARCATTLSPGRSFAVAEREKGLTAFVTDTETKPTSATPPKRIKFTHSCDPWSPKDAHSGPRCATLRCPGANKRAHMIVHMSRHGTADNQRRGNACGHERVCRQTVTGGKSRTLNGSSSGCRPIVCPSDACPDTRINFHPTRPLPAIHEAIRLAGQSNSRQRIPTRTEIG